MWQKLRDRFTAASPAAPAPFQPLYSLEEIAACAALPKIRVLAFATDHEETSARQLGPGVGGILASLLRRDLGFTRCCSVLGGEDTGYLGPHGFDLSDDELLQYLGDSIAIIRGQLQPLDSTGIALQVRIVHRDMATDDETLRFTVCATFDKLPLVMPAVASATCKRLGITVLPEVAKRWPQHTAKGWANLLRAAQCWEQKDEAAFAKLLQAGSVHPDAVSGVDREGAQSKVARQAAALANELEPDNAPLAFHAFCANCNFNSLPVGPRFEEMLRRGLTTTPGHGKSHMVLPHILARIPANVPYILAHSEAGYRLLQGNSFAQANYSMYLSLFAPQDKRVIELAMEAIKADPENSYGYQIAIDFYLARQLPDRALQYAEILLALCTHPVSDRTWYCFRQAPSVAKLIDAGQFDPQQFARSLIAQCRAAMKRI